MNAQLRNAFADRLDITRVAGCQTLDARLYASTTLDVAQPVYPLGKGLGFSNVTHG
jgi:hypothetical protein